MTRHLFVGGCLIAAAVCLSHPAAQEREDRTLLSHEQMRAIVNEASGERAMHHVLELVPYPRIRPTAEYQGHFQESEVMARFAKEYGFSTVEIESFPAPNRNWAPTFGELWMITAMEQRKLYDIHDVAVSVASNSANGDVTAELVDVGMGTRASDYEGRSVAGKVAIGSAGVGQIWAQAAQRGAVGAVGYNTLYPDRGVDVIPSSSIAVGANGFGWAVSPRVGHDLVARLARGEKISVRSLIRAETEPGELEMVHATVAGDPRSTEDVIISGHLYEGYLKQGANDDNSGCALTLEVGRAYIKLVQEGKLPKPKHTIHFLWVPEISGTNAWLNAHPGIAKRVFADLNFDMEGIRLTRSRSYWILQRTPDTFPSFLNDIGQSMMEFVSEITRERVRYRAGGYGPSLPVQAPNGSDDAFYIKIDKHYGSSDHVTYMQHGIPAVMFITWPDNWYHSSQDTPDKQDSTQYKRAAVVATGAMTVLATGGDEMAARVVSENLARGAERMGDSHRKGLSYMADVSDAGSLATAYHDAVVAIRHQAGVEKGVVRSASVLFDNPADGEKKVQAFEPLIEKRAAALLDEAKAAFTLQAAQRHVAAGDPATTPMSNDEKDASTLLVECVNGSSFSGCSAAPGAGGGRGAGGGPSTPGATGGRSGQAAGGQGATLPQHMSAEATILLGKKKTALEIRDFLSGEFEPISIADVMRYLRAREQAGVIKLTRRPEGR
ncbi:MAG TPA: M28 family peptidase [Vicinamibacterales bacterium]|nr:M28 family peptidase [Vicinamibacterales bacterium]